MTWKSTTIRSLGESASSFEMMTSAVIYRISRFGITDSKQRASSDGDRAFQWSTCRLMGKQSPIPPIVADSFDEWELQSRPVQHRPCRILVAVRGTEGKTSFVWLV